MKVLKIIFILSCLFAFINSVCEVEEKNSSIYKSYKDCVNRQFSSEEIEDGAYKCCYVKIEYIIENTKGKFYGCTALTESEYKNVSQAERELESQEFINDVDVDCESSFIKLGILFLLYFFI